MSNPLYQMLNSKNARPMPQNNNFFNMVNQFMQFKQNFNGDAKAQVMSLLNSGKMSQEQFNQLQNMASQFQNLMK